MDAYSDPTPRRDTTLKRDFIPSGLVQIQLHVVSRDEAAGSGEEAVMERAGM